MVPKGSIRNPRPLNCPPHKLPLTNSVKTGIQAAVVQGLQELTVNRQETKPKMRNSPGTELRFTRARVFKSLPVTCLLLKQRFAKGSAKSQPNVSNCP